MTDLEFLDALEFRAKIRKKDTALVDLHREDADRLYELAHEGYRKYVVYGYTTHLHASTVRILVTMARDKIVDRVATKLLNS